MENNKLAVKAHESYAFWDEALNSPNAGIKDGKTVLQNTDPDKLTLEDAQDAIKNDDIKKSSFSRELPNPVWLGYLDSNQE